MLRQGPLSLFVHGVIEYAAAALLIVAPFLFDFDSGAATAVSIMTGIAVLVVVATSGGRTGLVAVIPLLAHVAADFALAGFLIAAPFLFGFSDEGAPTGLFVSLGVAHLLVTIGTRFLGPARAEPSRPPPAAS